MKKCEFCGSRESESPHPTEHYTECYYYHVLYCDKNPNNINRHKSFVNELQESLRTKTIEIKKLIRQRDTFVQEQLVGKLVYFRRTDRNDYPKRGDDTFRIINARICDITGKVEIMIAGSWRKMDFNQDNFVFVDEELETNELDEFYDWCMEFTGTEFQWLWPSEELINEFRNRNKENSV